jgi:hypothetical protein
MTKPRSTKPAPIPLQKAPPSVISKSLAHLHQSVAAREKRLNSMFKKQGEARRQLNTSILKLVDPDSQRDAVRRILNDFQSMTMSGEHEGPPPFFADEVQWLGGQASAVAVAPFQHTFADPDGSSHEGGNFSDADGNMSISADPTSEGATAIAGVGFYFVPIEPAMTIVQIRSSVSFSYNWYTLGSWTFNAHSEGQLGLLVHHFDKNLNFSGDFDFPAPFFWNVSSDGANGQLQGSVTLSASPPLLVVGDAYHFMTYARVYCNSTDGYSHGHAELKAKCNSMSLDFPATPGP